MKHFRPRYILTVILAVLSVFAFSGIVSLINYRKLHGDAVQEKTLNREAVEFTMNNLASSWRELESMLTDRYQVEATFSSLALSQVGGKEKLPEDEAHENSVVMHISGEESSQEEEVQRRLGIEDSLLRGQRGYFAAPKEPSTLVVYSKIEKSSGYYVEWFEDTVLYDLIGQTLDISGIMKRTEIAYEVSAVFVSREPDSGEISDILYLNEQTLEGCEKIEDLGLSGEELEKSEYTFGTLEYGDGVFTYESGRSALPDGYVILLEPVPNLYAKAFGQAGYMIAAYIILLTTLLVADFSLYPYIRNNALTPEQEKNYQPSRIRSLAILFGICGTIMIMLCGAFIYALSGLYDDMARGRKRLSMVSESIRADTERYEQNIQSFQDTYLEFGNHIAGILDTYPALRDSTYLDTLADTISASAITLYDSNGRETVSSGPWIDLVLDEDPDSPDYEFRRILQGESFILQYPEPDGTSQADEMKIGIRIQDLSSSGRYGVMLICVDLSTVAEYDSDPKIAVRNILSNLSDPGTTLWFADAQTGQILVSGTEEMEGKGIDYVGLDESDLGGSLVRSLNTEEGAFFFTSLWMEASGILGWTNANDGVIAYYRGPDSIEMSGLIQLCLAGGFLFCVFYSLITWLILSGYTDNYFNQYKSLSYTGEEPETKAGRIRRKLSAIPPDRRGIIVLEIVVSVFLLLLIPSIRSGSGTTQASVYNYVFSGRWEKGINLFAAAGILFLLAKIVLTVIVVRLVTGIFASFSGPRGKTICRLIASILLYLAVFVFLIVSLGYLGVKRDAIVAGMGSLALAVSLGAQNFVADIFAGLTLVFEGTVHVGDVITVIAATEYQGKVIEIGIRNLTVLTQEGDLISVNNREVRVVKNLTQMNSRVICELTVSSNLSAEEIRQMLEEELPKVGKGNKRILQGPVYHGITKIGNGTMTLSVSAECREADYHYVKDRINVSLQRIFREHGYHI